MNALESTSTRPYLIRALYEWCTDNGFTPYVAVLVVVCVLVLWVYVKNGVFVLFFCFVVFCFFLLVSFCCPSVFLVVVLPLS